MKLHKTSVQDAFLIVLEPHLDDRGLFTEGFVKDRLGKAGLKFDVLRMNFAMSDRAGTVRGLHWQADPWSQGKIVYSVSGNIFDVIVDVRPGSGTYGMSFTTTLTPLANAVFVPRGVAHGWQALDDKAKIMYLVDNEYMPSHERGLRYTDPAVIWPLPPVMVSERDLGWPMFRELEPQ